MRWLRGILVANLMFVALAGSASAGSPGPTKSLGKAKGIEYRTATFPSVASPAGATVECKADTFAVGGGGLIDGSDGQSRLLSDTPTPLNPDDSSSGWSAIGSSASGRDMRTWAMCHKDPLPYDSLATAFPATPGIQSATIACPSGRLVAGGVINDDSFVLTILESRPIDLPSDADSQPDDAWQFVGENTGASTANPTIFIACSDTADLSYVTKTKQVPQSAMGKPLAKCPNRFAVTSGGFDANSGGTLTGLSPWDSKDRKKVPEDGWQARVYNASIDTLPVTSTAICLRKF